MSWFIPLGAAALIGGLALLVTGIRKHKAQHPKHVAMLIFLVAIIIHGDLKLGLSR